MTSATFKGYMHQQIRLEVDTLPVGFHIDAVRITAMLPDGLAVHVSVNEKTARDIADGLTWCADAVKARAGK